MNKGEFVKAVAETANCTQKDAGIVFDAVIDTIVKTLKGEKKFKLLALEHLNLCQRLQQQKSTHLQSKQLRLPLVKLQNLNLEKALKQCLMTNLLAIFIKKTPNLVFFCFAFQFFNNSCFFCCELSLKKSFICFIFSFLSDWCFVVLQWARCCNNRNLNVCLQILFQNQ